MIEVSGVLSSCETAAMNSSLSRSSSRSCSFCALSSDACLASVLSALTWAVTSREMPKVPMIWPSSSSSGIFVVDTRRPAARVGLPLHLARDRLAGLDDVLLVRERVGGVLGS